MKEEAKEILDQIQRQERKRKILVVVCFLLGFTIICITLFIYLYAPGKSIEVNGVITGLHGQPMHKKGDVLYFLIRLDNGKKIKVRKPNGAIFLKDRRVIVTETTTLFFGIKRYSFKGYSSENEELK